MPDEGSRTTARKRITLPNDGGTVDVPVITKIAFIDPYERYQETEHTIDNSGESLRLTHVDPVYPVTNGVADTSQALFVERVDKWPVFDALERGQETIVEFDNVTGNDTLPPSFISHLKTHVVRYKNASNPDIWIDSELIDSFTIVDPYQRYQETTYVLNNPQTSDEAQADPADPNIADSGNGIDAPWRTDPFQNIVNWNGEPSTAGGPPEFLQCGGRGGIIFLFGPGSTYWDNPHTMNNSTVNEFFQTPEFPTVGMTGWLTGNPNPSGLPAFGPPGSDFFASVSGSSVTWTVIGSDGAHSFSFNFGDWVIHTKHVGQWLYNFDSITLGPLQQNSGVPFNYSIAAFVKMKLSGPW